MEYRRFGSTGLDVSVIGLGTGGASRLGRSYGATEEDSVRVVHRALDLGINYFDTAQNYRNEHVLGRALVGHRDEVVISTKVGAAFADGSMLTPAGLAEAVETSLTKLQTDVIDVFHFHRASVRTYPYITEVLLPEMLALRDAGKIRFLGVSESSSQDVEHETLQLALRDGFFDVVMVSFNLFNQSARDILFKQTIAQDVGVEIMASARSQFSRPELLVEELERLVAAGELDASDIDPAHPLDFVMSQGRELGLPEVSYRFAGYEPGVGVVLVGTGRVEHLEENVGAILRGPLPDELHDVLVERFSHLRAEVHVPGRTLGLP